MKKNQHLTQPKEHKKESASHSTQRTSNLINTSLNPKHIKKNQHLTQPKEHKKESTSHSNNEHQT